MLARDRVVELLCVGRMFPPENEQEILECGTEVVETLISIMFDDELGAAESRGAGYGPVHAARLLGELRAEPAVLPMLDVLRETDWDHLIHDAVLQALSKIGAPVIEPALTAYQGSDDPEFRSSVASVLAGCGVRDERIYQLLVGRFRTEPDDAAIDFGTYGDPRALEHLLRAFDELPLEDDEHWLANETLVDIREAIEELGGNLTVEQETKFAVAMEPRIRGREIEESLPVVRRERPGRNDPCWCGSTKKYKKFRQPRRDPSIRAASVHRKGVVGVQRAAPAGDRDRRGVAGR